ncbi:MAG: ornithine cyclodeaminase family protein [Clostridiaceae bacterium]
MVKKDLINRGIILIDEQRVRNNLPMKDCIPAVENAYSQFSEGKTILPPIVSMALEDRNAELDVKTGFVPGCDKIGVKIASGFYNNEKLYGIPSWPSIIMLADGSTGFPCAVMDGGYITTVRTGAAGAVGAKYLARKDSSTVFILGAGNQARIQLIGLKEVLPCLKKVYVHSPIDDGHFKYAEEMKEKTALEIIPVADKNDLPAAVGEADLIVTVTPSREPQILRSWIKPGTHINAIGSDGPGKQELDPAILRDAKVVADSFKQTAILGECQHAIKAGHMDLSGKGLWAEIGEVLNGTKAGRENENEITVFDATGMAVLDIAAASLVYELVQKDSDVEYFKMVRV